MYNFPPIRRLLFLSGILLIVASCSSTESLQDDADQQASSESGDENEKEVFVGYGTQRDSLTTGSVDRVDSEEVGRPSSRSPLEMLQGRVAGVTVHRRGGGFAVRIRGQSTFLGSNDPLYIVDGMQVDPGPHGFIGIPPSEVASIEVLKDASTTSMYGSQGGNGVVVITTKQYESVQ